MDNSRSLPNATNTHWKPPPNQNPSSTLLFKLLMQKAIINMRATTSLLCENLSSLDTYMAMVNSNIEEFNKYIKMNYKGLTSHGKSCDDLMINLFKGYQSASNNEFVRYIKQKKDSYNDGKDIEPEQLMMLVLNKYKILKKQNSWNAKSPEEEQIVALSAELQKIKDANLKLIRVIKGRTSKNNGNSRNKQQCNWKQGKGGHQNKSSNKQNDNKWAWKKVPPKDNEAKTKTVNGSEYHWCDEHMAWVWHKASECQLKHKREGNNENEQCKNSSKQGALANALSAILTNLDDDAHQEWLLRAFRCLLSSAVYTLFITASTFMAEPMLLIPIFFNVLVIDMLLATVFTASFWILFIRLLLAIDCKHKVTQNASWALMMFCMWIKSHIKTNHVWYCKWQPTLTYTTHSRYCPCYYARSSKWTSCIASKSKQTLISPILQACTAETQTPVQSNLPLTKSFDTNSFVIGIDNHASRTMSNRKEHFITLEPIQGRKYDE